MKTLIVNWALKLFDSILVKVLCHVSSKRIKLSINMTCTYGGGGNMGRVEILYNIVIFIFLLVAVARMG